jgi:hypothetical protein
MGSSPRPRVCLSTISNGSLRAVTEMLDSAAPYVDEAVIVVAPGHLTELFSARLPVPTTRIERAWQGYAITRTLALKAAEKRAEWVLTLDDDDRFQAGCKMPPLDDARIGSYMLPITLGGTSFYRPHLTRRGHDWRFEGCGSSGLHEALYGDGKAGVETWDDLVYLSGPPSIPTAERYAEHARLLQIALDEQPDNTRTAFYLAQSLRDAADLSGGRDRIKLGAALAAYTHRGNMPQGFSEETFWSWMNAGRLAWRLGMPWEACVSFYEYARSWGPLRAEPLRDLARLYEAWGKSIEANEAKERADLCPFPSSALLFVERACYTNTDPCHR